MLEIGFPKFGRFNHDRSGRACGFRIAAGWQMRCPRQLVRGADVSAAFPRGHQMRHNMHTQQ